MRASYRTSVAFGNTTSGTDPSGAITPVTNDYFLVICNAVGSTNLTPTCADGNTGGTYALGGAIAYGAGANTLSWFIRTTLVPNTTSTTVTVTIGAHASCEVVVYALSGCPTAGVSAIIQSASQANQAGSTTPAPTFSSIPSTQNLILSAVANTTNPAGVSVSSSLVSGAWVRDQNVGQATPPCGLSTQHTNSWLSTSKVTWGSTSATAFASLSIEVAAEPTTIGTNASKLTSVAFAAPPVGVAAGKVTAALFPTAPIGVACSKLVAVAFLNAANTNLPVWPTLTMPNGYLLNLYSTSWDLTPAASPTTFAVNSGSLPPGLALHSPSADLGNITGTPTTAGAYTFTLLATNAYGTAVSPSYTITISAPVGSSGCVVY